MPYSYRNLNQWYQPMAYRGYKQAASAPMPMDPTMMGGAPPMDPAMMGGAPPMDPAMMGGAPPMDPAMMGGAPPMDPAMMGGAPPMDPAAAMGLPPSAPPPGGDPAAAGGDPAAADAGGKKSKKQQSDETMQQILTALYNMQVQLAVLMKAVGAEIPPEVLIMPPGAGGPDISNPVPKMVDLGGGGEAAPEAAAEGAPPVVEPGGEPQIGGEMPKTGSLKDILFKRDSLRDILFSYGY